MVFIGSIIFGIFTPGSWWQLCSAGASSSSMSIPTLDRRRIAAMTRRCTKESMKKSEIGSGKKLPGSEILLDVGKMKLKVRKINNVKLFIISHFYRVRKSPSDRSVEEKDKLQMWCRMECG